MPPTFTAPVLFSSAVASLKYVGDISACPSMREIIGNLAIAIAAFKPFAVRPVGLSTKTTLESATANSLAISLVRSLDGPRARITSNAPP